ncbi:MAG TPA: hypothetical protein VNZ22_21375, partial [Bacillota bacterium]|nr:hypothetical protein [Bacillota bacterium]
PSPSVLGLPSPNNKEKLKNFNVFSFRPVFAPAQNAKRPRWAARLGVECSMSLFAEKKNGTR